MSFAKTLRGMAIATVTSIALATSALADSGIMIMDPYARASSPNAKAGAAFMVIHNKGEMDDRLISAASDVAARVELHTHIDKGDGVMLMREVEDGFPIPAGGKHMLARGGDHVMFMGLNRSLNDGDMIEVTLTFEQAGEVVVEILVDLNRKPAHGGMDHGAHKHGDDS